MGTKQNNKMIIRHQDADVILFLVSFSTSVQCWIWPSVSRQVPNKPGGTLQKSEDLGSGHLVISFLNHQLFRNTAYVRYFCHYVISWICDFVWVYSVFVNLTVGNISFDVFGPWAFQKYSIIRFLKIFWTWRWQTTNDNQMNLEQLNIEQSRLLQ